MSGGRLYLSRSIHACCTLVVETRMLFVGASCEGSTVRNFRIPACPSARHRIRRNCRSSSGNLTAVADTTRTGSLRLFLDSAEIRDWKEWIPSGVFYGITTNPTLLYRAGLRVDLESAKQLCESAQELGVSELQLQARGNSVDNTVRYSLMLHELQQKAENAPRIVIKLPCTKIGLGAAAELSQRDIPVTITGVYAAHQVMCAIAVGAEYAAPYLGRMNDLGLDGFSQIEQMGACVSTARSSLRILVASIRSVDDITRLATSPRAAGKLDTYTFSPGVADALINVPATIAAAEAFDLDSLASLKTY